MSDTKVTAEHVQSFQIAQERLSTITQQLHRAFVAGEMKVKQSAFEEMLQASFALVEQGTALVALLGGSDEDKVGILTKSSVKKSAAKAPLKKTSAKSADKKSAVAKTEEKSKKEASVKKSAVKVAKTTVKKTDSDKVGAAPLVAVKKTLTKKASATNKAGAKK